MSLDLAAALDTSAAGPLRLALQQAIGRGEPIALNAGKVERVGQACLQILAAAQVAARDADLDFTITQPSPAFSEMSALAGLGFPVAA